jgi:hypothetical protein
LESEKNETFATIYVPVISGGTSKERLIGYGGMPPVGDRRRVMTDDGGRTKGIELKKGDVYGGNG